MRGSTTRARFFCLQVNVALLTLLEMNPGGEVHFYLAADCDNTVLLKMSVQEDDGKQFREKGLFGNCKAYRGLRGLCIALLLAKHRLKTSVGKEPILIEPSSLGETWVRSLSVSLSDK